MAGSARRERELARRRYERRRLREQQQRARRRRRNTVLGALVGTLAVVGAAVGLGVGLSGGGSTQTATTATSPTAAPTATATPAAAATRCAPIKPNPPKAGQPHIPDVTGAPPTKLIVKDVKKGTGPVATKGSSLSVTYIGVSCSTGTVFDASYLHGGTPFTVSPLGTASVITGWNQGLVGVRAGGVRELVIPPDLGYGASGAGSIKPNETLIFLITVKSVKK